MRRRKASLGSVYRLSNVATHASGMPSSTSRCNSLRSPRTVRVQDATTTAPIRSATGSRVSTRTGRSPPGAAAHQTSPLTKGVRASRLRGHGQTPALLPSAADVRTAARRVRRQAGRGRAQWPAVRLQSAKGGFQAQARRGGAPSHRADGRRVELSCSQYTSASDAWAPFCRL
jgi:hypothetical protein